MHADTVTVQYERADCWSFIFCTSFCRSPDKCSIYYVGSCLFVASNIYIYLILPSGSIFFVILVLEVSLVMFCIVAKWYKRERNKLLQEQRFVDMISTFSNSVQAPTLHKNWQLFLQQYIHQHLLFTLSINLALV